MTQSKKIKIYAVVLAIDIVAVALFCYPQLRTLTSFGIIALFVVLKLVDTFLKIDKNSDENGNVRPAFIWDQLTFIICLILFIVVILFAFRFWSNADGSTQMALGVFSIFWVPALVLIDIVLAVSIYAISSAVRKRLLGE